MKTEAGTGRYTPVNRRCAGFLTPRLGIGRGVPLPIHSLYVVSKNLFWHPSEQCGGLMNTSS